MPLSIDIHAKVATSPVHQTPVFTVPAAAKGLGAKSAKEAFLAVYDTVKASLMDELTARCEMDAGRFAYLTVAMDQNCQGGKLNRGICVVEVVQALLAGQDGALGQSKDALIFAAAVCGWAIEFMQAHFLVEDDIMDHSLTRRGKPCWYKMPGVNISMAINDGLIIFAWCTRMMELLVQWHPLYATLLRQLHNADFLTTIGQLYDTSAMYDKMDPEAPLPTTTEYVDYTVHTYNRIVKYKTAYYTYHVPLIMGLAVVGQLQTLPADKVEDLAVTMGEYFQVQDDFLDCYADPSVIGKIGTDIEDRKCSWLACTFLAHATAEQKATFKANYGEDDKAKVAVIKKLYLDAQVPKHFEAYEAAIVKKVDDLCAELQELNAGFVVAAKQLWGRTYKRSK